MAIFPEIDLSSLSVEKVFPFLPLRPDYLLANENTSAECVLEGKKLHERNVEAWLKKHGSAEEKKIWQLLCKVDPVHGNERAELVERETDLMERIDERLEECLVHIKGTDDSGPSSPMPFYLAARLVCLKTFLAAENKFATANEIKDMLRASLHLGFEPAAAFLMTYTAETATSDQDLADIEQLFLEHKDNEECQLTVTQLLIRYTDIPFSEQSEGILLKKLWEKARKGHIDALRLLFLKVGRKCSEDHWDEYCEKVNELLEERAKTQKDAGGLYAMSSFELVRYDYFYVMEDDDDENDGVFIADKDEEFSEVARNKTCFYDALQTNNADGPKFDNEQNDEWLDAKPDFEQAYSLGDLWSGLFLAHQNLQMQETLEQGMELLEKLVNTDNYPPAQAYLASLQCSDEAQMAIAALQNSDDRRTHELMRAAATQGDSPLLEKQYADYLLLKVIKDMDAYHGDGQFTQEASACLEDLVAEMKKGRPWACLAVAKLVLCGQVNVSDNPVKTAAQCLSFAISQGLDEAIVFAAAALDCYPNLSGMLAPGLVDDALTNGSLRGYPLCSTLVKLREIGIKAWLIKPLKHYSKKSSRLFADLEANSRLYGGAGKLVSNLHMLTSILVPAKTNPLLIRNLLPMCPALEDPRYHHWFRIQMHCAGELFFTYYDLFVGVILTEAMFWLDKELSPQQAKLAEDKIWPCVVELHVSLREARDIMMECMEEFNVDMNYFRKQKGMLDSSLLVSLQRKMAKKRRKKKK